MRHLFCLLLSGALTVSLAQTEINGTRLIRGSLTVNGPLNYCADAGSTDSYACNPYPAIAAYTPGSCYLFKANTANTGAATLALNGLPAIPIRKPTATVFEDLADSDLRAGQIAMVCYDGANMLMMSQLGNAAVNGGGGGGAAFDPNDDTTVWFVEEFAGGTTTTGQVGAFGARFNTISSGTGSYIGGGTPTPQHPGAFRIASSGTGANSGGSVSLSNSGSSAFVNTDDLLAATWDFRWIVRVSSTSDMRLRVGVHGDTTQVVPSSGWWIRYDSNSTFNDDTKNGGSGTWVAQMCTSCTSDTNGAVQFGRAPSTGWWMFRIWKSGTTISMSVTNGGTTTTKTYCPSGCDATVTVPSNTGWAPGVSGASETAASVTIDVDRISGTLTGLSRY